MDGWTIRPIRMPDEHLPNSANDPWLCRRCGTAWPCQTAGEYLDPGACQCGSPTFWEKRGPRRWHIGPACYTPAQKLEAIAAELHQWHMANPHYPPSHYYPPKPRRPKRQKPPYRHTPAGPGDIKPGTWLWVRPGGLHPGWGDITHLGMLTRPGVPKCEVWLHIDETVHEVRADRLILSLTPQEAGAEARGRRTLPPEWQWLKWTVRQHLDHTGTEPEQPSAVDSTGTQGALFDPAA